LPNGAYTYLRGLENLTLQQNLKRAIVQWLLLSWYECNLYTIVISGQHFSTGTMKEWLH